MIMRIACPSCAAEYEVPTARLTPRKMVRCTRCGSEWMAVQDAEEPTQEPEPAPPADHPLAERPVLPAVTVPGLTEPGLTAMDRLAAFPPPGRSPAGLIGAWVLTVLVLVGATAAAIIWRQDVMRAWPPSGRILTTIDQIMSAPAQTASNSPK